MKLFKFMKDGGNESRVWGFFFVEIKSLFSVVLLRFDDGTREAYHSHAFNSVSWVLKGQLDEQRHLGTNTIFKPSFKPVITRRDNLHQVRSNGTTWVLSFRGPWLDYWTEYLPDTEEVVFLTHGRKETARIPV